MLALVIWSPCPQKTETTTTGPNGQSQQEVTYTYKHTDRPDLTPLQRQIASLCGVNDIDYCKQGDAVGKGIRCPTLQISPDTKTCPVSATIDAFADLAGIVKVDGGASVNLDGQLVGQTAGHTHAGREGEELCAKSYIVARYDFTAKLTITAAVGTYVVFRGRQDIHQLAMETREDVCVWMDHPKDTGLKCTNPLPEPP